MWLASLPWYDLVELRSATDSLWREIASKLRERGVDAPDALSRTMPYERQWTSGKLLFGQACGYDVRIAYAADLQLVATPCYALPGCEGPSYRSFVVVREDSRAQRIEDLRGLRCVINTPTSHSGMNALRSLVAPLARDGRFFGGVQVSGAHERSLALLRERRVDVAAIDCVTHGLLARHRPQALEGTRIACLTPAVATPPFVTSASTPADVLEQLRSALSEVIARPRDPTVLERLAIEGVQVLRLADYEPIADHKASADELGYREFQALEPVRS